MEMYGRLGDSSTSALDERERLAFQYGCFATQERTSLVIG
jgi:hypothetical protein